LVLKETKRALHGLKDLEGQPKLKELRTQKTEEKEKFEVSQLMKASANDGKRSSDQYVCSFNQLLVSYKNESEGFSDRVFKVKIETASSFVLSGILLLLLLDSRLLSFLDFIGGFSESIRKKLKWRSNSFE
jgi:hypothetical protein